jgi:hypothetical protein
LFSIFTAQPAFAHGEHGEATPVLGGMSLITLDGFQAELLGSPRPLRIGAENKIIIKILRDGLLSLCETQGYMGVRSFLNRSTAPEKTRLQNLIALRFPYPSPPKVWAGIILSRFSSKKRVLIWCALLSQNSMEKFSPPAVLIFT